MDFVTIPAATFELGWRFLLPEDLRADPRCAALLDEHIARCSNPRSVALSEFQVARVAIRISELIGDPYELEEVQTLEALCDLVDARLATANLRLPTEDELEATAGGGLFPWGDRIPSGIPYRTETDFVAHTKPTSRGLQLLGDPYKVELCRTALKFGDGGSAICGGLPWPMPWLPLSPSFRLTDRDISECFPETLEECFVRPIRNG